MTSFFSDLLNVIAERGRNLVVGPSVEIGEDKAPLEIAEALLSVKGEASGVALASELFDSYDRLNPEGRLDFFRALADQFGVDLATLKKVVAAFQNTSSQTNATLLHDAAEPRRQELFRRLNQSPNGTESLVRMREDLLPLVKEQAELKEVDKDFSHLFSSWFNRGFLVLKSITWATPAAILEKIIDYEAVHEIDSWEELRRRIEPTDRRCYAFFHPAMADEPLVFVEVALTTDIPDAIAPLLTDERKPLRARDAKTAVFYSISNCQKGLSGISFGHFLIKQVVEELARELPHIDIFVTLSPIPGFRTWLSSLMDDGIAENIPEDDRSHLARLSNAEWHSDTALVPVMQSLLLPLAAQYFLQAKNGQGKPLDPVARFHLGNGASLERINWLADTSVKGLAQSAGMMVNYLYERSAIEKNHEAYENDHRIAASSAVTRLANQLPPYRGGAQE